LTKAPRASGPIPARERGQINIDTLRTRPVQSATCRRSAPSGRTTDWCALPCRCPACPIDLVAVVTVPRMTNCGRAGLLTRIDHPALRAARLAQTDALRGT
jgi:hypothetical protein